MLVAVMFVFTCTRGTAAGTDGPQLGLLKCSFSAIYSKLNSSLSGTSYNDANALFPQQSYPILSYWFGLLSADDESS